jgi:hypothetical protein
MSRRLLISLCAATGALLLPAGAQARYLHRHLAVASIARALPAASPETVVQDDAVLLHGTDAQIADALGKIRAVGVGRVRVTAGWSVIAPQPDSAQRPAFDDTDPAAYPPGNWDNLDRIVRMADAAGIRVMIDIAFWAPRWATQSRPDETIRLRTNIDPVLYAHFATAVARRYSGTWTPPAPPVGQPPPQPEPSPDGNFLTKLLGGGKADPPPPPPAAPATTAPPIALPAVDIFTIWNEPNHPGFLQPQWTTEDGRLVPHAADIYRAMVRAAYPAIKAAAPGARVLIGATSSMGATEPGRSGVTPMKFLRRFACVDDRWRPIATGSCSGFTTIPGDGWSHHPYSLRTLPDAIPHDPDKLPVASTARLLAALHRLVRAGRLAPANADLYMTEYGYETSPPDPQAVFGPGRQAQLLSWAEFIGTRDPRVRMWPQFLLIDRPGDRAGPRMRPFGDWQSGLYYADWSPKPAAASYRTPTFAACVARHGHRRVMVWGRVRDGQAAAVTLDREIKGAHTAARAVAHVAQVPAGREVLRFVPYVRGARYRLTWEGPAGTLAGPAVAPVDCTGS